MQTWNPWGNLSGKLWEGHLTLSELHFLLLKRGRMLTAALGGSLHTYVCLFGPDALCMCVCVVLPCKLKFHAVFSVCKFIYIFIYVEAHSLCSTLEMSYTFSHSHRWNTYDAFNSISICTTFPEKNVNCCTLHAKHKHALLMRAGVKWKCEILVRLQSQIWPNFGFFSFLTTDRNAGTQPCIAVCTCMDTNSQLLLLLTLFLCLLTLLSCTAPDKQHQKQHSHQPQRKHPFTCSGIYLLNPLQLLYVCVCICWSRCLSVLSPFAYSFTCFCSSVCLCCGLSLIFVSLPRY